MATKVNPVYARLGAAIKAEARAQGLTQVPLARKVGVSQAQVSRLLKGAQGLRFCVLLRFCKVLDVKPSHLLAGVDL